MGSELQARSVVAYIGIGSNLDDPRSQVCRGAAALARLAHSRLLALSRLYRTAPVGSRDQPDYINAVASLETCLSPVGLLAVLQRVEQDQGRRRDGERWGPRTLDLDILLYGDARIDQPGLRIPHAELAKRAFVLVPLADVVPAGFEITGHGLLADLLDACPRASVVALPQRQEHGCDAGGQLAESDPSVH